jgi:hypothetical protein
MVSLSNHRPEPFDSPFALSHELVKGSKGGRFAQDRLFEDACIVQWIWDSANEEKLCYTEKNEISIHQG